MERYERNNFEFKKVIGQGSYSTVYLANLKLNGKPFAIKVLGKRHIIKHQKVKYVNAEKDILQETGSHPNIVKLFCTFQDVENLYFVLEYVANGDLLRIMQKFTFGTSECKWFSAQIIDAMEWIHSKNIIHRDLKPENILVDEKFIVKLTDFGTSKKISDDSKNSFVGTAEYCPPELLNERSTSFYSDIWSFGCILFHMANHRVPFKANTEYLTFQLILKAEFQHEFVTPNVIQDLINRILLLDPIQRLTLSQIKAHEFFKGADSFKCPLIPDDQSELLVPFDSDSDSNNDSFGSI